MLDIPGEWIVQGGAVSVLLLATWLVLTGRIVGTRTVDRIVAAAERREGDWKAAYTASEEARRVQSQQLGKLLESAHVQDALLRALPRPEEEKT